MKKSRGRCYSKEDRAVIDETSKKIALLLEESKTNPLDYWLVMTKVDDHLKHNTSN